MDSESSFSTLIFKRPEVLTQPDVSWLPTFTDTGTGSPVIGDVSIRLSPSTTTPSSGMRSPGRISTILPTTAEPAGTSRTVPFSSRRTVSRTKINGFHDLTAALFNRAVFECFTDPVEEHNSDRLPKLVDTESADGRDAH